MPLLMQKARKHLENSKAEAKLPMMVAQKVEGGVVELIVREIEERVGLEASMGSVNLHSCLKPSDPVAEFKACSFFDIPEDIKDYQ